MAVCALTAMTGCTETNMLDMSIFRGEQADLVQSSNAAADMLVQQARQNLGPVKLIHVEALSSLYPKNIRTHGGMGRNMPLSPADPAQVVPPARQPPFGAVISSQVAARLSQMGFNVSGPMAAPGTPTAMIGGYYARAHGRVLISLRLTDSRDGRILSSYDYSLPATSEIEDLMSTDPDSFRLFDF